MDRNIEQHDDLIDLGAASVETKGGGDSALDTMGQRKQIGISDD